jgi:hypothetical protein
MVKALNPLPGTSVKYYIIERPDLKKMIRFWDENTFIGTSDNIPGLDKISIRTIETKSLQKISLCNVSVVY